MFFFRIPIWAVALAVMTAAGLISAPRAGASSEPSEEGLPDAYALTFYQTGSGAGQSASSRYTIESAIRTAAPEPSNAESENYKIENPISPVTAANNALAIVLGKKVMLSWDSSGVPADYQGYDIYRSRAGAPYTRINEAPVSTPSYEDTHLENGAYYYLVYVVAAGGGSFQWTAPISAVVNLAAARHWQRY